MDNFINLKKNIRLAQSVTKPRLFFCSPSVTGALGKTRPCHFCTKVAAAKYRCSKCELAYCSIECFNASQHRECSEFFYKKLVFEELRLRRTDENEMKKFYDILKRNSALNEEIGDYTDLIRMIDEVEEKKEEENIDEMDKLVEMITTRLNIDDEKDMTNLWHRLTESERTNFASLLNEVEGEIATSMQWKPWWLEDNYQQCRIDYEGSSLHLVMRKVQPDGQEIFTPPPEAGSNEWKFPKLRLKPLMTIPVAKANPVVSNSILPLLIVYCHICRQFDGEPAIANRKESDFAWNSLDLWDQLNRLCPSLMSTTTSYRISNQSMDELVTLLLPMIDDANKDKDIDGKKEYLNAVLLADIEHILDQPLLIARMANLLALSDLQTIITRLFNANAKTTPKETKNRIRLALRKIDYYLAWLYRHQDLGQVFDHWLQAVRSTKGQIQCELDNGYTRSEFLSEKYCVN